MEYDCLAKEYASHRRAHPEVLKHLISLCSSDSRVLEVGCGSANYISAICRAVGCRCYGIDPSREMLRIAREAAPGVELSLGKAERLDFGVAFFDVVFSVDVIHHVQHICEYFRQAKAVLKPGGRFVTVTDSEWIIQNRRPLATHFPETVSVDLHRYPPISVLCRLLAEEGYTGISEKVVEMEYLLDDIEPYRQKSFSSLHLISPECFNSGIAKLEQDVAQSALRCISRYLILSATAG